MANPYYKGPHWRALRSDALKRAGYKCEVRGCGSRERLTVDHIESRPRHAEVPTAFDVLQNIRVLCASHDSQRKEDTSGVRRGRKEFYVKGASVDGSPIDPNHLWNKQN